MEPSACWDPSTTAIPIDSLYSPTSRRPSDETSASTRATTVDFDIGGAEFRDEAVTFTRVDVYGTYDAADLLELRAGVDHYENPDTEAERDLFVFEDPALFGRGYWRYFVGAAHRLPWKLRLSEEIAWIDAPDTADHLRWRVDLSKRDLLLDGSNLTASVYNLNGLGVEGYGARLSAYIPFWNHRAAISPAFLFRWIDIGNEGEDFELTSLHVRGHWRIGAAWELSAGVSHSFGTEIEAYWMDFGISFRW